MYSCVQVCFTVWFLLFKLDQRKALNLNLLVFYWPMSVYSHPLIHAVDLCGELLGNSLFSLDINHIVMFLFVFVFRPLGASVGAEERRRPEARRSPTGPAQDQEEPSHRDHLH